MPNGTPANGNGKIDTPVPKVKHIFISNILEGAYKGYHGLTNQERSYWTLYDTVDSNRVLFYNGDDKLVITSAPILPAHFEYSKQLMGWKNVHNYYPRFPSPFICEDIMSQEKFRIRIEEVIRANPGINLIPYRSTPEFAEMVNYFRRKKLEFETPESMDSNNEFVNIYAHSKRGFRHLWNKAFPTGSSLQIDLPLGFITGNRDEAIEAAWWFAQQKKSFVIKYNRGIQGIGVLILYYSNLPDTKRAFVREMQDELRDKMWDEPSIIVEELIDIDKNNMGGSPSIEFFIDQSGRVHPTYAGEQVMADDRKTFRGIYINPEIIKNKHIKTAFKAGHLFGKELADLGYRGVFDVDLVVSKDNKLYAVESNLRRTGGTHVHEAAVELLGADYTSKYHVLIDDILLHDEARINYKKAMALLSDIYYKPEYKSGVLIANPDMLQVNILNILIVTHDAEEMKRLRGLIKRRFKQDMHSSNVVLFENKDGF